MQNISKASPAYRILTIDFPGGDPNYILSIQNTDTLEISRIDIIQLGSHLDLLLQLSPQDIYMVAYTLGQIHLYEEKEYLKQVSGQTALM